jgi:hypothetical protein
VLLAIHPLSTSHSSLHPQSLAHNRYSEKEREKGWKEPASENIWIICVSTVFMVRENNVILTKSHFPWGAERVGP